MIRFVLYIHNHQPVGNFDDVFEFAYCHSYRPVLERLLAHPGVKFGIHNSGPLCEWLDRHHPEYAEMLTEAVRRGQAEIMGSAFAEPILSLIPRRDAVDQIKYFKDYLFRKYQYEVKGIWLTERVWEPSLISVLHEAGIEYTLLDDTHFRFAGLAADDLYSYYITEDENRILKVFPIDMKLRYLIPFHPIDETVEFLRRESGLHPGSLKILGDDGEKFGVWPGTFDWVHTNRWLENFLARLGSEPDIQTVLLRDVLAEPPAGRVYLPTASYEEMGEWSLPVAAGRDYDELKQRVDQKYFYLIRGGYFKNFLRKYPEVNLMQKRMVFVSQNVADDPEAKLALWRGQCSCVYWHGIFGGLYLPHLREAVYRNLIEAESHCIPVGSRVTDFDIDGRDEIVMSTTGLFAVLRPETGGFLELDDRSRLVNLCNYVGRRPEKYHARIPEADTGREVKSIHEVVRSKEAGLKRFLIYDRDERGFALDRQLTRIPSAEEFSAGEGIGPIVAYGKYEFVDPRDRCVRFTDHDRIGLGKTIRLIDHDGRRIEIMYEGEHPLFGIEFSIGLFNPNLTINGRFNLREMQSLDNVSSFTIEADAMKSITISVTTPCSIRSYPIETISSSEAGFERNLQGFCLLLAGAGAPVVTIAL